ncbi:protein of unknown function [Raineyella antarctica]|uniref:DUF5134 domain-containing protein n=1 Tax=Raineyella antarctica TaxID=1577474 RepID=A0A1G6HSH7_9ACTN|nr:DUF5134 domain-containing protein [Raineyella antarctica]SDB96815.1 protein of unknown function [Raineyella antarctica]
MFTYADTPVTFIGLFILFAFSLAWGLYELTRRQDRVQAVSNTLHLVMSVVMLLMVSRATWRPLASTVPAWLLVGFFAAAVLWFVALALTGRGSRAHFAGHAAMFGAMTWHLAGMEVKMASMSKAMPSGPMGGHAHARLPMAAAAGPADPMWWVAVVGAPLMAYLLVAAVLDLVRVVRSAPAPAAAPHAAPLLVGAGAPLAEVPGVPQVHATGCHEPRTVASTSFRLAALAAFAMNFGMFWMSTGLMVPVLPWMTHLAF